jgi:hypothetical protein
MPRLATVIAVYGVAVGLGYLIGDRGVPPFGAVPQSPSLSLRRVGWVLGQPDPRGPPEAWAALETDIATVREGFPPSIREMFDLEVAVRGLKTGGKSDWTEAQQHCLALKWSRCDHAALEELRVRGRP